MSGKSSLTMTQNINQKCSLSLKDKQDSNLGTLFPYFNSINTFSKF